MKTNTRAMAIEILCRWAAGKAPVDQVGEEVMSGVVFTDPRDRQFCWVLIHGVIRWQRYLDWILGKYSQHPLRKMKPRTLQSLRVGLFQLLFLDRVPASAAINETVAALKASRQPRWLTGFVNGLLRNIDRHRAELPDPFQTNGELSPAVRFSHPDWLVDRWQQRYGAARTAALLERNNTLPPLTVRVNTGLVTADRLVAALQAAGISARPGDYAPDAVRIDDCRSPIPQLPGYAEGWFQVQDEAAQLVTLLLAPFAGAPYLDGCAGLGGKTTHLAQLLPSSARVVAVEPNIRRARLLEENLQRLHLDQRVGIVTAELAAVVGRGERFAGVLIDAPCSGLGVVRRHPDIRWNRTEADLSRYQQTQLALLGSGAALVAPGGVLVYATCSMEPEEGEAVVAQFLAEHPSFVLTDSRPYLPETAAGLVDGQGMLRSAPDLHDLDGFFAARLVKRD